MPLSKTTTDHQEIQKWAEARGGKPVCVRRTGSATDAGVLRINFPGYSNDKSLEEIPWEEFFEKFDHNGLAMVYQEQTAAGEVSNFNKLVKRETAEMKSRPRNAKASSMRKTGTEAKAKTSASKGRTKTKEAARS